MTTDERQTSAADTEQGQQSAHKPKTGPRADDLHDVPDSIREDRATGAKEAAKKNVETRKKVEEVGAADAPEPTRFGDWEFGGRCSDF